MNEFICNNLNVLCDETIGKTISVKLFGKEILAEGRIQTGSYTNQDGKKIYTTDVVLDRVEFCGSKTQADTDAEPVPF